MGTCLWRFALVSLAIVTGCTMPEEPSPQQVALPLLAAPGDPPNHLWVLPTDWAVPAYQSQELRIAYATLEGILARTRPEIWFNAQEGYPHWLDHLEANYGI